MVKIDFRKFITDHIWFGWAREIESDWAAVVAGLDDFPTLNYRWKCSPGLFNRLWPVKCRDKDYPLWWIKLNYKITGKTN